MARPRKPFPELCYHSSSRYWCYYRRGKRVPLSRDEQTARQQFAQVIAQIAAHGEVLPKRGAAAGMTIDELVLTYMNWAETTKYIKRGEVTRQIWRVRGAVGILRRLFGTTLAAEFDEFALEQCQQAMVAKKWCRVEINGRIGCVKRMFRWAAKRRLVPAATAGALLIVDGLRKGSGLARESELPEPVERTVVDATLEHCGPVIRAMIELQWLTGMRPSEVCHIRPCDLDRSRDVWIYRVADEWNKTAHFGIVRSVPLGPECQKILSPFLDRLPGAFCFSPAEEFAWWLTKRRQGRKTPLWPSHAKHIKAKRRGRKFQPCYDAYGYRQAIGYALGRANRSRAKQRPAPPPLPDWHPHQLRHAAATRIRRDHGLDAAQSLLGHSTAAMTERYARIGLGPATELMRRIG